MKRVCLFLPVEQIEGLRTLHRKTGAPVAEIVRRVLSEFLKGAKCLIIALLLTAFAVAGAAAQSKPITIKGHTLGERGKVDCAADVHRPNGDRDKWQAECKLGYWEEGRWPSDYREYRAGRLVRINLAFNKSDDLTGAGILLNAIKKFGQPTGVTHPTFQNGFGARWEDHVYEWKFPGAYIALYLSDRPILSGYTIGILEAMTASEHAADLAEQRKKKPAF